MTLVSFIFRVLIAPEEKSVENASGDFSGNFEVPVL
jgi:hypothetical protein